MSKLIQILKLIEDGMVDQHEGSVAVGKLLKELYVDSAMKTADNIDKRNNAEPVAAKAENLFRGENIRSFIGIRFRLIGRTNIKSVRLVL
jgi:hypothetical protein